MTITIFDILKDIDKHNINFYTELPIDVQKKEHPLVLMKWMFGTGDPLKTMMLNECVNPYVFNLHNHKELVMKLLNVCSNGQYTRYKWIKTKKKKTLKYPTIIHVIKSTFMYNTKHAMDVINILSTEQLLGYAADLGYQKKELTVLKKELRAKTKNES